MECSCEVVGRKGDVVQLRIDVSLASLVLATTARGMRRKPKQPPKPPQRELSLLSFRAQLFDFICAAGERGRMLDSCYKFGRAAGHPSEPGIRGDIYHMVYDGFLRRDPDLNPGKSTYVWTGIPLGKTRRTRKQANAEAHVSN